MNPALKQAILARGFGALGLAGMALSEETD